VAVHDPLEVAAHARHHDHVEALAESPAPEVVLVDRSVRHGELIERVPRPPFILRIEPGVVDRDARKVERVRRRRRRARLCSDRECEARRELTRGGRRHALEDHRAGREGVASDHHALLDR
jgi:hypothetical protein